jgi:AraC-like DNA-binding protein
MLVLLMRTDETEETLLTGCLPKVWHFNSESERIRSSISLTVQFLAQELEQRSVGYSAASHRLAEFMFVQLLREVIDSRAPDVLGWIKGLSSPTLSPVLAALHRKPEHRWKIGELAALARMSRSAFCAEFSREIGESPIAYARNLRMHAAARSLEKGMTVKHAAAIAGYSQPYGFQKAFRRTFGSSPSSWRRR